jgi:hypothetical protein
VGAQNYAGFDLAERASDDDAWMAVSQTVFVALEVRLSANGRSGTQ